jgi:AcrR family transcriptional regulator
VILLAGQEEIFAEFAALEGEKSGESLFRKQRNRWTRNQMRVARILADPLAAAVTNREIAEEVGLSESYLYKLFNDDDFMTYVEWLRTDDKQAKLMISRVWKELFKEMWRYPAKVKLAMGALGIYEEKQAQQTVFNSYENLTDEEVQERLEKFLAFKNERMASDDR